MEPIQVIGLILVITALFALGGKFVIYFKNREIVLLKEKYDQLLSASKNEHEAVRVALSEDGFKQLKRTEEHYQRKLDEKDQNIQQLVEEIEALKSWKEELGIKLAKFEGASQGSTERLIFKLLEHNQKLNRAMTQKWNVVRDDLSRELNATIEKVKALFCDAEQLHHDGIEIISEYESRLPEDFKKKVHEDLLQITDGSKKI